MSSWTQLSGGGPACSAGVKHGAVAKVSYNVEFFVHSWPRRSEDYDTQKARTYSLAGEGTSQLAAMLEDATRSSALTLVDAPSRFRFPHFSIT